MSNTFRRTKYRERDVDGIELKRRTESLKEKEGYEEIQQESEIVRELQEDYPELFPSYRFN